MIKSFKVWIFSLWLIIVPNYYYAQEIGFIKTQLLDSYIYETSGLIYLNSEYISHNDSGGQPELYIIDSTNGEIKHTIIIKDAINRDWEDLASDDNYIYIGDFGNNSGSRTDLRIYKVKKPNFLQKYPKLELLNTFYFQFEDQKAFEKNFRETPFDCEAFFVINNTAYIFTKNWKDQTTGLYKLPLDGTTKTASLISVLNVECLITGADFNKLNNSIVCSGYKKGFPIKPILVFIGFNPANESISYLKMHNLNYCNHQIEGIAWVNNKTVCISNETYSTFHAKIAWYNITGINKISLSKLNNNYVLSLPDKCSGKYVIKNSNNDILQYSRIKRKDKSIIIDIPNDADKLFIQVARTKAWFKII
jgi:hypothetical protein